MCRLRCCSRRREPRCVRYAFLLAGKHTVFGRVVEGLDILDRISELYLATHTYIHTHTLFFGPGACTCAMPSALQRTTNEV